MNNITVFTPSYNRETTLPRLYESLINQTCKKFVWLVIDDGSNDQTVSLIQQWIQENKINIVLKIQQNQGKHIAMRNAIKECDSTWLVCVDSDDYLEPNAVDFMVSDIVDIETNGAIGAIYPRKMHNTKSLEFPKGVNSIDIMDAKNLFNISETAILFRTDKLKKIEIPQFQDEKFLSEEILYIQLAAYGKFIAKNRFFYVSDYRQDGLTKNLFKLWKKNPQATIRLLNNRYHFSKNYPVSIRMAQMVKAILNLNGLCIAKNMSILNNTPNKILSILLYFPSLIWSKIRFSD